MAKGKEGKLMEQKQAVRSVLSAVRATVLEGSFGNEKNHYLLNNIKARTQATETAWIFFGMMTANASLISQRIFNPQKNGGPDKKQLLLLQSARSCAPSYLFK